MRLTLALTILAAGLVTTQHTDLPTVPSAAPEATKHHRHPASRVSRAMRRHRLASKPNAPAKALTSEPRAGHPSVDPPSSDDLRQTATLHDWSGVAACESSGNWHINSGNGYMGGLQMDAAFWANYGGLEFASRPDLATQAEQVVVAERGLAVQGIGAWPSCGRFLQAAS